ncbi:YitT family protein [Pantoea sp. Mhis]|uniref:YitT family protein n=1 Tax=Pantoea sp. Mhis TaxID=2576759 RepID=UPI0013571FC8|nr:YitT family protein [Pantoea sp. Mhis]MXP56770.1 YitT family protein [Pantoea sp. Mhis]
MDKNIKFSKTSHSYIEDVLAILFGTLVISFGVLMLKQAGTLTGSSAGIAFLISYATSLSFGSIFFFINIPFYFLAIGHMGWEFTLKTCIAVALVSIFTYIHPLFAHFSVINPFYATIFGNIIMGMGFIVLFRHKACLGGVNILALYLQDNIGLRAGKLQMIVDSCVVLASLFVVTIPMLISSIVGAIVLNVIIVINHRPERYIV